MLLKEVHVFAGRVKIVSHLSCRTSAILKYFCPLLTNRYRDLGRDGQTDREKYRKTDRWMMAELYHSNFVGEGGGGGGGGKKITASDIVAENNIVCLVLEHILITSFICSAKYSSNIL